MKESLLIYVVTRVKPFKLQLLSDTCWCWIGKDIHKRLSAAVQGSLVLEANEPISAWCDTPDHLKSERRGRYPRLVPRASGCSW